MSEKRVEAWKQIQGLRAAAAKAASARKAERIFMRHFKLSLEELVVLSENAEWKDMRCGGNKWAEINREVIKLRDAIDRHDADLTVKLLERIPLMCHNTGRLDEKLEKLDHGIPE